MIDHETLLEDAIEAINQLFGDTSVSQKQTKASLEELIGNINIMLDTLE